MPKLIPPEPVSDQLRATNLIESPCLICPIKPGNEPGLDGKPWEFVECRVIVLDAHGIVADVDGLRISWALVRPGLLKHLNEWVHGCPVKPKRAVILEPLEGGELAVAERVLAELDEEA